MQNEVVAAKQVLSQVAMSMAEIHRMKLERMKADQNQYDRPDFLWHYLLQSFSTMGRSAGWHGLIGNQDNYTRVTVDALLLLQPADRERVVREVCRVAKVRMPDRKAGFIISCFDHIQRMGGLAPATARLRAAPGRKAKIEYLMTFPGIGPKYARNIMMDVYHEDFRDSIAVDTRIKEISSALGMTFRNYADHESFYLEVAQMAGLNGWELDRLLYNFKDDFLREIVRKRRN